MGIKVRERKGTYRYLAIGLLTLLISISMAVIAFGGQLEDATAAYGRGDYATALRLIKPLAEQSDAGAQYFLANMYLEGQGVSPDSKKAVKWFREAAEQGFVSAQHDLGVMYFNGQGIPQDYTQAAKWYRKVAEQGYPDGQYKLGVMYYYGQGVPKDYILAHMWINLAASRFIESIGGIWLGMREEAVKTRDEVASKMNAEQIAEAKRLAREWKPKKEAR